MARALLVGCGDLGSRHLQALAGLDLLEAIDVVDPRPEALALGRQRLEETPDRLPGVRVRWLDALEQAERAPQLCIVATQAEGRCRLAQTLISRMGARALLLEKIVGQSPGEVETLAAFAAEHGASAWVNFKTRAYPVHRRIKAKLDPADPVVLQAAGGNHGLANNGVHTADMFAFYDGAAAIELCDASIDPVLHASKRGASVFDLSGTLHGRSARGGHFLLTYDGTHRNSELLMIMTRGYRALVDHANRWAMESLAETGWTWEPLPFEGNLLVSAMTREFARDILTAGRCELPTVQESLVAHRFILTALQPVFAKLLSRDLALCPVT
jgi:predicted dehydrogenase